MNDLQKRLADELQKTDQIYEASVLISEVQFILRDAGTTHIRCKIWYDLDQREYRSDLSHARPGMMSSGTVWAGSPEAALQFQLDRLVHGYGPSGAAEVELVENPFFDNPNLSDS